MGIVLSKAKIVDGMYKIPAGYAASFTLLVIYQQNSGTYEDTKYAMHMQELPFYVGDAKQARKMNPSELKYYITPEVELNSK